MKRILTIIILLCIVVVFGGALYYLYAKNKKAPIQYNTEKATHQTIIKKTIATGSIVPKEEVNIKPNISGIIQEIYIGSGDYIKENDPIAKIKVIPSASSLQNARNAVETSKIDFENQRKIYNRQKTLYRKKVISKNEYGEFRTAYKKALQNYRAAKENFEIIQTGETSNSEENSNTVIRSTMDGMVIEVPIKEGNQVIESNNFNDGTSIAIIADVNQMIFEGKIDESEVGRIQEGLPLEITIGAIENKKFAATLDYIAPKGVSENGTIQFEIKGSLNKEDDTFIRAGLSANAAIILDKAENVLAIKEALVQYDPKTQTPFVEIEKGDQVFVKKGIELGVSDGIYVEIKKGISKRDQIKVWNITTE